MTSSPPPAPQSRPVPARAGAGLVLTLATLAMIAPFTIDSVFPAFARIGEQFHADEAAVQQLVGGYLAAFAVMSIFHGPLSDALGRRRVILGGLTVYLLAMIGAALAPSLGVLIALRVVQGASAGAATIVSRVIIRDLYDGREAQRLMADVMMIFSIAPALAPIVGGWLLLLGSWRFVFAAIAVYGAIALVLTWRLPETLPPDQRIPLRVGSILRALAQVARSWRLWRIGLANAFGFASQFLFIAAAPLIVTRLLGLGERGFWVLFVPLIAGMMSGAWVTGRLPVTRRRLITIGYAGAIASCALNLLLVHGRPAFTGGLQWGLLAAVLGPMLIAFFTAMVFGPTQLEVLDLFPRERGAAQSFATFLQVAMNAVLAGVVAPAVTASLTDVALASLGFVLVGAALWTWHLVATRWRGEPAR